MEEPIDGILDGEKEDPLLCEERKKLRKKNFADGIKITFFFARAKIPYFGFYMSQDTISRDQHHGFDDENHVEIQQQEQRQQ